MATVTGSWAPSSGVNQRMRLILDYTVPTPSPGQTSVTVTGTVTLGAGYSFFWNGASFSWSGSLLGSGSASKNTNVPTNGAQQIHTFSQTVSLSGSASSRSVSFSITGIGYVGSGTVATVSASIPIPALATQPAPTNVTLSWPSNTSQDMSLSWSGGPVHRIEHRARSLAGSGTATWGPWQLYTGVEQSSPYAVTELGGMHERQMRVRRGTGSAASPWAESNVVRQFLQPNEPTGVAVTRQSDSRHTITWSYAEPWNRPVSNFQVWRWLASDENWVLIATPSRGARSYVDTANRFDELVYYRVYAVNAYTAIPSATAMVRTTPAAATDVSTERTGPNAATLRWVNQATSATGITIQEQTSSDLGVSWSGWADRAGSIDFTPVAQSRALSALNAALWYRFRVVHIAANAAPNPTLYGYSAPSQIIRPAAKPNMPSMLAPSGVVSSAEDVLFRWRHNPTDGSDQTAYELRHRPQGGAWVTVSGTSTNVQERPVAITTPGVFEAQVRTKGQHADWSDWSPVVAFEVLDPPTVEVTSPEADGVVPSNRVTATISYYDGTGAVMAGWRAELADEHGVLIEQRSGTGPISAITFATHLSNFTDYQVTVWVTSGTSLESLPAVVEFSTDFLPPVPPDMDAEWLEPQGLVRLAVTNHDGDGVATVETVSNRIERSTDLGQTWTVLLDNAPLDVGLDDTLVPLSTIAWFRAVAVGPLGTEAATDPPVEVSTSSGRVWLTGENGATQSFHVNAQLDINESHESVSEQYYGRELPIAHYGEARPHVIGVAGTLTETEGYNSPLTSLLGQDVYYRDPLGNAFWASIRGGFNRRQNPGPLRQNVSFTVERVHRV